MRNVELSFFLMSVDLIANSIPYFINFQILIDCFDISYFYGRIWVTIGCENMEIQIVKRKAGRHSELAREVMEVSDVSTLRELLIQITKKTIEQQYAQKEAVQLNNEEIKAQAVSGKVTFQQLYQDQRVAIDQSVATMIQDYEDGLFRVFIEGEECVFLDDPLYLKEHDECVFLRLIMLAGRLW